MATYDLNEKINNNGAEYTITNLEYSEGGGINIPQEGNQYVVLTIEVNNLSSDSVQYNSRNFSLEASDGNKYIPEVML